MSLLVVPPIGFMLLMGCFTYIAYKIYFPNYQNNKNNQDNQSDNTQSLYLYKATAIYDLMDYDVNDDLYEMDIDEHIRTLIKELDCNFIISIGHTLLISSKNEFNHKFSDDCTYLNNLILRTIPTVYYDVVEFEVESEHDYKQMVRDFTLEHMYQNGNIRIITPTKIMTLDRYKINDLNMYLDFFLRNKNIKQD